MLNEQISVLRELSIPMHRLFSRRYKPHQAYGKFQTIGRVRDAELDWQGVLIKAEAGCLRLDIIAPDCVCVRFSPEGVFPLPRSYGVQKTDWQAPEFELEETPEVLTIKVIGGMLCLVHRSDSRLTFLTPYGTPIGQEAEPITFRQGEFKLSRLLSPDARCYGLGAQAAQLNLRGKRYTLWQSTSERDAAALLPFLMMVSDQAVDAIFWDNPSRGCVDVGLANPQQVVFSGSAGELRYYQFCGTPVSILQRCTELIGRPPLPPLWALGAHMLAPQPTSAESLRAFATECRAQQIPCDALALAPDYMEDGRPFTWDNARFPKPSALISELARRGFKILLPVTPVSKEISAEVAVKYPDGQPARLKTGHGQACLIDLTDSRGRMWWSERCAEVLRSGISGLWQPEGLPALPDFAQYSCDGVPSSHVTAHNVYTGCLASAGQAALLAMQPARRPHVLAQAGQGGTQRSGWAGIALGERADWRALRRLLSAILNAGLSGMALSGAMPNYTLEADPELFVRWLQLSAFLPLCSLPKPALAAPLWRVEPKFAVIGRQYLNLRYQLLPYLYAAAADAAQQGMPMLRPLWLEAPRESALRAVEDVFMLGRSLLIAPVLEKGATERIVPLPAGKWYDFFTAQPYTGGQVVRLAAPLERMPILVRAGHVLLLWEAQQYVGQKPPEELLLRVYVGKAESSLYEDEGEGFTHQRGIYCWLYFTCQTAPNGHVTLHWRRVGEYGAPYLRYRFELHGIPDEPDSIYLDDTAAPLWYYEKNTVEFTVTQPFERARIEMRQRSDQRATLLRSPLRGKD